MLIVVFKIIAGAQIEAELSGEVEPTIEEGSCDKKVPLKLGFGLISSFFHTEA
ncbi:hypothetical protein CCACVL1_25352 [Corchorus capsularis]|uniref:Uncharacterized protein n=1 Tax=Corchorus capsularis TaxID=210143 RepID=A0A1R3GL53_COCAP|nr:hypothetical protein CCACVL1_25352 [Corchorus capsularis]